MNELTATQIAEGGWILLAAYALMQARAAAKAAWPTVKAWLEREVKGGDDAK